MDQCTVENRYPVRLLRSRCLLLSKTALYWECLHNRDDFLTMEVVPVIEVRSLHVYMLARQTGSWR